MFVEFRVGSSLFLMHDTFFSTCDCQNRHEHRSDSDTKGHNAFASRAPAAYLPKTGPKNLINMMTIDVDFFEGFVWG